MRFSLLLFGLVLALFSAFLGLIHGSLSWLMNLDHFLNECKLIVLILGYNFFFFHGSSIKF